jgi:hypothetical protein
MSDKRVISAKNVEILKLVQLGKRSGEIQEKLGVTPGMVASARHRLLNVFETGNYEVGPNIEQKGGMRHARIVNDNGSAFENSSDKPESAQESRVYRRPPGQSPLGISGIRTGTVIERIKDREDAGIFKPEIKEGMTAKEIMDQYDTFKGLKSTRSQPQRRQEIEVNEDASFEN